MTVMGMYSMDMMSDRASVGSMDASASHTHCACAHTAFRAIVNILDAMILASIFVVLFLVILGGLSNSLVLTILVLLAVLPVFRRIKPKR